MEIVQFEIPGHGRRVGFIDGENVVDVTARRPEFASLVDVFHAATRAAIRLPEFIRSLVPSRDATTLAYSSLLDASPGGNEPYLLPPLDHVDPHRVLITGTGLTHTGSMQSRDQMHAAGNGAERSQSPLTDSARMFEIGRRGGRPAAGQRGAAPEWFYKGDGGILRGHRAPLEIPAFALDGGEEPEIIGCYVIDDRGRPRRIGFALSNEWSDHATEQLNYLYLAPSKLRTCAVGPSINTDSDFQDLELRCTVQRQGKSIYDSGLLHSGENWMCHSLANLEDHHFKYAQHRRPGDVHLHFFGTSKLSHSTRTWKFQPGDEVRVEAAGFSAALVNPVIAGGPEDGSVVAVESA